MTEPQTPANPGWTPLEGALPDLLAQHPSPFIALADGTLPAVILRQAFPLDQCRAVVRRLYERGGIEERAGTAFDGVGTSLGNLGSDPETFFAHARQTHALYAHLFDGIQDPVAFVYQSLSALAPGHQVQVAHEPDGRLYGPAIFRIYGAGKGHPPHFDSVRWRERREQYAVYQFEHQFAGVLCLQAAEAHPDSGECILHRQFWNPEIQAHLQDGTFHAYAAERGLERLRIELDAGDFYVFNTRHIHEVPPIVGDTPRIVLATFIGFSPDREEVIVWS